MNMLRGAMFSALQEHVADLPPPVPEEGHRPLSGGEDPRLPARWRGGSSSRRTRTAKERCVACYLCAVACPVGCIALQAAEEKYGEALPALFPDQFLALHLLRFLRGGLPDLRHPAHPRFRDGRVRPARTGLRKGRPSRRAAKVNIPATIFTAFRDWLSRERQGRGPEGGTPRPTS